MDFLASRESVRSIQGGRDSQETMMSPRSHSTASPLSHRLREMLTVKPSASFLTFPEAEDSPPQMEDGYHSPSDIRSFELAEQPSHRPPSPVARHKPVVAHSAASTTLSKIENELRGTSYSNEPSTSTRPPSFESLASRAGSIATLTDRSVQTPGVLSLLLGASDSAPSTDIPVATRSEAICRSLRHQLDSSSRALVIADAAHNEAYQQLKRELEHEVC
eukprot:GHVN01076917.1.p1 GENE.GHVN01076917.1~~GHVN01076917.1.p1  ORF type:complete len:219 (+),score=29.24 GHVN01076917.1:136-792(+)